MKLVPLSKGTFSVVDDEDYERITFAGKWSAVDCGGALYARREVLDRSQGMPAIRRTLYLHTFITGWPFVDHINGMTLDNRRENLRLANAALNNRNRRGGASKSGYKGVFWHAKTRTWAARITVNGRTHSLRYHPTAEAAARVYDRAALEFHGEFARTNFPREDYIK